MNAIELEQYWQHDPRWEGIQRPYKGEDVVRLRGSIEIEHTLARRGADRLWNLLQTEPYLPTLGALTGNQAVQQVQAGLKAIYLSGWQVAADNNLAGQMYPDQSLYPANSVPTVVRALNAAFMRADQIQTREGGGDTYWFAPIIADAEAGFGGPLNVFELMKWMIEAGAAAVHFEDQLAAAKKCGHMGGKVLVPIQAFVEKLVAARLAADVSGVPTLILARTDADSARLLSGQADERDEPFLTGERTPDGFIGYTGGPAAAVCRAKAYAPYCDLIWCETSKPDLEEAKKFADGVHEEFPDKMLAYNCSPSFNWRRKLDEATIAKFQRELGAMGYKYQFVTLAGFHSINHHMFMLAKDYVAEGMSGYVKFQEQEFLAAKLHKFSAIKHQRFVGTGYFDDVSSTISRGLTSVQALAGSTEQEQFT